MRAADRFEFSTQASHQREGMLAASQALMKGRKAIVSVLISVGLTFLSGLGGFAVVAFAGTMFDFDTTWWGLAGWFAGGGLYMLSFQLLYSQMARLITQRALHKAPQAIIFDKDGMTYEALPAIWTTPWSMIDGVVETRETVTVSVSGIAFAIPKSTIGDGADVDTLINDLNAQISNA